MTDFSQFGEEDAFHAIVSYLRSPDKGGYSNYGYGVYLPNVIRHHLMTIHQMQFQETEQFVRKLSPHFYAAAWEMELLSSLVSSGMNQAATWSGCVASIPFLKFTPVITLAK